MFLRLFYQNNHMGTPIQAEGVIFVSEKSLNGQTSCPIANFSPKNFQKTAGRNISTYMYLNEHIM